MIRRAPRAVVRAQDDVGVEELEQPAEVAVAAGGDEGVDDLAVGGRGVAVGSLDAAAGPGGELAGRGRRAVDDRGDVLEGHREDVVEHEREALGGLERLEHDEQRGSHGVGGQGLALRVRRRLVRVGDHRIGQAPALQRLLAAALARVEHRQAHARDDRRQPAADVVDVARVGSLDPQPGLLEGVVGLGS